MLFTVSVRSAGDHVMRVTQFTLSRSYPKPTIFKENQSLLPRLCLSLQLVRIANGLAFFFGLWESLDRQVCW